jgi:hypothetical protein
VKWSGGLPNERWIKRRSVVDSCSAAGKGLRCGGSLSQRDGSHGGSPAAGEPPPSPSLRPTDAPLTAASRVRTYVRVTTQGSPYGPFRRALERQHVPAALAAAAELPQVALADALELLLLPRDADEACHRATALRWHARSWREVRDVTLAEATAVLALLAGLAEGAPAAAARALAELLAAAELKQPARVLLRWASSR